MVCVVSVWCVDCVVCFVFYQVEYQVVVECGVQGFECFYQWQLCFVQSVYFELVGVVVVQWCGGVFVVDVGGSYVLCCVYCCVFVGECGGDFFWQQVWQYVLFGCGQCIGSCFEL